MSLDADVLKTEAMSEACCVCGAVTGDLLTPEEHDADAPPGDPPLRAVLLHLNHTKTVPSGRLCSLCIRKALDAYSFSTSLAACGPPPLSEKIRALRKRLHELTQKIDVFIVVGGGVNGAYDEKDIIMVDKEALAAAARADSQEVLRAKSLSGEHCYQCTVCPLTFQRASEYRTHVESHGAGATHSCWSCGAQFASHEAARAHYEEHEQGIKDLVCHLCNITMQNQAEMRSHESTCASRCPVPSCEAVFSTRAELTTHVSVHETVCGACYRVLPSAAARAAHVLAHRQQRQFLCGYDQCILRFATRANLLAHLRKCHGSEPEAAAEHPAPSPAAPVPCESCHRTFASVAAMKRHARVHKGEKLRANRQKQVPMEWAGASGEEEGDGGVEYLEMETLEDLEPDAILGNL